MPNGKPGLGERIASWANDFLVSLGLAQIVDNLFSHMEAEQRDWENIDSLDKLEHWCIKWGVKDKAVVAGRARELGASQQQISRLVNLESATLLDNPSAFVGDVMRAAFESPMWQEFAEIHGATVIDPWIASMVGDKLPSDAPEVEAIRRFLGTQITFEALGSFLSSMAEILSIGQLEDFGRMFTDSKWTLGTCFTSWQTTSPIIEATILKPLQRLINLTFRPADFTRSQWMDLFALGEIEPERLGLELARQGHDSEKIGWLLKLAERQPSRSDLLAMWRKEIIGPVTFAEGLRREGYPEEWVQNYLKLYQSDEAAEEKGAYLGTLRKAFKEDLIGDEELAEALKQQGRSDEAIALEIAVLKLGQEVEEKTAAKSDIRAAYVEDVIGKPEAANALAMAGFAAHTIELLLNTWDKQKSPTYRKINKAEILKAWGTGVLSRPEAYQSLLNVGYDERGATVLMETYARTHLATKPPAERELSASDIMLAWHAEVIEDGEAVTKLVGIGLSEEDAQLKFETFSRLHPHISQAISKELHKDDILEAWGRGVIDTGEVAERLADIGYEAKDVTLIMNSYALRPEALPQEPTVSELIGATRRGVIDPAQLSQKLVAKGISEEDTQFYVAYATEPLPEKTRSLSRKDILDLWTLGRHPRAWALERLLALNYSPEDAEDILWLASPDIEDTETYVLWKAGILEPEVAAAMWQSMGFTEEQIAAILEAE